MEQGPRDGGLTLFCPACPKPGVNLPADWKVQYDRDTIMRQYVIDGNFTAQHMKMNKPELDVALSDGKGFMVAEVPYQSHLKQSLDSKEASVYRSWKLDLQQSPGYQCSMVDFQKGERYMNTDYSICNALSYHSENITTALVIYDVGCQWSVNFRSWVKNSPSLLLPPALEIVQPQLHQECWPLGQDKQISKYLSYQTCPSKEGTDKEKDRKGMDKPDSY
ncbi:hypothetical protein EDD15DRAFT_2370384 [Pisolithus albus]|nr:hypothetical protein EDD15DRAFT_2370384 [Pisolithus albus]